MGIQKLTPFSRRKPSFVSLLALLVVCGFAAPALHGCGMERVDEVLTRNVTVELIDWHVSGFWVINAPVAWVRVSNYNNVPIKEVTIEFDAFDPAGVQLNRGKDTFEGEVGPMTSKNFTEQYLGLVGLATDKIKIKLLSVKAVE